MPDADFNAPIVAFDGSQDLTSVEFPVSVEIPSQSSDSVYKVVLYDITGYGNCPCRGFGYRSYCKHLFAARTVVGIGEEKEAENHELVDPEVESTIDIGDFDGILG